MDYISVGLSLFLAILAVSAAVLASWSFYFERHKAGWGFCGLLVLCAVLVYVPQLESIKSAVIDAKFNRTVLSEAKETLERSKRLAAISAQLSYMTLGWSGRLGAPYAKDKQVVLDDVERLLNELSIDLDARRSASRTFVQLIGYDLGGLYSQVMGKLVDATERRLERGKSDPEGARLVEQFQRAKSEFSKRNDRIILVENYDLPEMIQLLTPTELMSDREKAIAARFASELLSLFEASARKRGYTRETADLLDKYREDVDIERKFKELFGNSN